MVKSVCAARVLAAFSALTAIWIRAPSSSPIKPKQDANHTAEMLDKALDLSPNHAGRRRQRLETEALVEGYHARLGGPRAKPDRERRAPAGLSGACHGVKDFVLGAARVYGAFRRKRYKNTISSGVTGQ